MLRELVEENALITLRASGEWKENWAGKLTEKTTPMRMDLESADSDNTECNGENVDGANECNAKRN